MDPLEETVAAARRGDSTALNSLFARQLPPLMAFLRMKAGGLLTAKESVSDLAQSVCREVLQDMRLLEWRGEEAFRAWLFLQATRKIADRYRYYRQERRDAAREQHMVSTPASSSDEEAETMLRCYASICTPSRHASAREELQRVESALASLPAAQRDAVALSRLMGLSYAEIAGRLDVSESAVRGLVARGLARVASRLRTVS